MLMLRLLTVAVTGATALALPQSAAASTGPDRGAVRQALNRAVTAGAPGILAQVNDAGGPWFGTAGVADTATGRPRLPADHYRIGSTTKTFVAAVLLQLVGEKKLSLDDTVEKWLPGTVDGHGHDGSHITVRQLLNHTSGVFNYTADPDFFAKLSGPAFLQHRYDTYTPRQLVAVAMAHPPAFAPGTGWGYSNTDYVLAGMIVERVTGRTLADEVSRRFIQPLGLTGTSLPGQDIHLRDPHGQDYSTLFVTTPGATVYDVTELNPSSAGAAGEMVSTAGDLNRFFSALLRGQLLPPAQQRDMFTTVPTTNFIPDSRYGLGVFSQRLSCGVTVWGHPGTIHGSQSWTVGTRDGSAMLSLNVNGDWVDQVGIGTDVSQAEFCPVAAHR